MCTRSRWDDLERDGDLVPFDAPSCPLCGYRLMLPWDRYWECPKCGGVMITSA